MSKRKQDEDQGDEHEPAIWIYPEGSLVKARCLVCGWSVVGSASSPTHTLDWYVRDHVARFHHAS